MSGQELFPADQQLFIEGINLGKSGLKLGHTGAIRLIGLGVRQLDADFRLFRLERRDLVRNGRQLLFLFGIQSERL